MSWLESDHRRSNRTTGRKRTPVTNVASTALRNSGEMLLGCSGRKTLRREQCDMSSCRPNYLRQKIAIARQRIQNSYELCIRGYN
jgi:hypothetical protein